MPPNRQFQQRREAMPSAILPGQIMSRAELAEAVNQYLWHTKGERREMDAHTIARYERGVIRWPNDSYREAFRVVLHATDTELGFTPARRRREQAGQQIGTAIAELIRPLQPGVVATDFEDLIDWSGKPPTRADWSDVVRVRFATRAAASAENKLGGGTATSLAMQFVHRLGCLVRAQASPAVRRALLEAVGNLSGVAGYAAFDAGDHATADRRFRFALACADAAGSWELRASTLADMARRAAYAGDTDAALSLIEVAQVRSDRLSATVRAMLSALRAQYLATMGRGDDALTEVARADEYFAGRMPATDAPWLCFYDEAEHLGSTGKALIPVAMATRQIETVAERIGRAVELQPADYPRSQTFSLIRLATITMQLGDPRAAAELGMRAVENTGRLDSLRLRTELRSLAAAAARHSDVSDAANLHESISHHTAPKAAP
ncbi:XRE family transcriptional regulator [Nocardia mexicana]|uniref:XRE family transcriptional regulator n=1 Tax=Nocardia mexicana TaxID=279262 RepID=A0A370H4I1_9NOCA|nr:XRE family transcriptional regulator [Nocardia mexicana]RDI51055.1 hypothetical protein DFR68_105532 [Nocardia mexicana]